MDQGDVARFFSTKRLDLTDGGVLFEVVTQDGERVGSSTSEDGATDLEAALNLAVTEWVENNPADHVVA